MRSYMGGRGHVVFMEEKRFPIRKKKETSSSPITKSNASQPVAFEEGRHSREKGWNISFFR